MHNLVPLKNIFFILSATNHMDIVVPIIRSLCWLRNFWAAEWIFRIHFYCWLEFFPRNNLFFFEIFVFEIFFLENQDRMQDFFRIAVLFLGQNRWFFYFSGFSRPKILSDQMSKCAVYVFTPKLFLQLNSKITKPKRWWG